MSAPRPAEVLGWMREHEEAMTVLLSDLARAESPSLDPATQHGPFAILQAELTAAGMAVRALPGGAVGDHLYARPALRARRAPLQLLIGHMDTVWPLGTVEEMPVVTADGNLHGPGVFDMKGGLVQMAFALRAAQALGIPLPAQPVVLVNTDEEIGSRDSGRWVSLLARRSVRAFVLEPPIGADGRLKTRRKGVARFTVTAIGRAAHAGVDPERGASAVHEIALQVARLFDLNDPDRGVTVNVGTVDGGLRPNVVAPRATAVVDVRAPTAGDARRVEAAIRALTPLGPGLSIEVEGGFGRPPLEATPRNRALWETARRIGDELGLGLEEAAVGGASDGNTASQHTATLDGLGPVGDGAHAPHEHVVVSRMPERAALLALLLAEPAEAAP